MRRYRIRQHRFTECFSQFLLPEVQGQCLTFFDRYFALMWRGSYESCLEYRDCCMEVKDEPEPS